MTEAEAQTTKPGAPSKDERLYMASQWRLMWWKFLDHRLAVFSSCVLIFLYVMAAETVRGHVSSGEFDAAFSEILSWMPAIESYFVEVFVNHEEACIRQNRHALLNAVFSGITAVADLTQIEKRETAAE